MRTIKLFYDEHIGDTFGPINNVILQSTVDINKKLEAEYQVNLLTTRDFSWARGIGSYVHMAQEADIVICLLPYFLNDTMFLIGATQALNKPLILLIDKDLEINDIPYELLEHANYHTFDKSSTNSSAFLGTLTEYILDAVIHPDNWVYSKSKKQNTKETKTVFISYSHRDKSNLERLQVHLKPLERIGYIQLWSDTLIKSGEKWKQEIEKALNTAAIAILFISADFLASDFIINNELQPLLQYAETKGTIIIPIVLKPCRFLRDKTLSQFQSINDPIIPLSKLSDSEQEEIYERLSQRIELALKSS